MPIVIAHKKMFISLFAVDVTFGIPIPELLLDAAGRARSAPRHHRRVFPDRQGERQQKLDLKTIAFVADDGEATRNTIDGAHTNWKKYAPDLKVVYDKTYPPTTTDFTPIIRALQSVNPDVVVFASYPPDSVGIIRSLHELGLKAKILGGGMTGPQTTSAKMALGPMLNGIVDFDWWMPAPKLQFDGVMDLIGRYQKRAGEEKTDPLGYYLRAVGLCRHAGARRGDRGGEDTRPGQGRRLCPDPHVQDRRRRCNHRQEGGMGDRPGC